MGGVEQLVPLYHLMWRGWREKEVNYRCNSRSAVLKNRSTQHPQYKKIAVITYFLVLRFLRVWFLITADPESDKFNYSVVQSDLKILKKDTFHKPATY